MSRFSGKNCRLKDNSWIRRPDDDDDDIDQDPNYGKYILSHNRSDETPTSPRTKDTSFTRTTQSGTSVQALSKRFSGSHDDLDNNVFPSGRRASTNRTTTTTVTKDGTTETTITTTTSTLRSSSSSPTKTFTERVLSSSKSAPYSPYSTKTQVTEKTVSSPKDAEDKLFETLISTPTKQDYSPTDSAEDKLYDTLIPSPLKDDYSPTSRESSVYSTKTVTVKSSSNGDDYKTVTTKTSSVSTPEDELYGTLIPFNIQSSSVKRREIVEVESSKGLKSPTPLSPSSSRTSVSYSSYPDDTSITTRSTSYTISSTPSYEYSGVSSPPSYTSSLYRSRSEELLSDPVYPKSPYRNSILLEKDLCTHCRQPFNGEAKMILDDMKINCHATCFKCTACKSSLSNMKAGDSLWVYKKMVHCENCFAITRDKWRLTSA